MTYSLAFFYWNPERVAFTIPWINHPIVWYGLFFVTGYLLAYLLLIPLFTSLLDPLHTQPKKMRAQVLGLLDRLTWFLVIGTIIGARLGHVFFYDWPHFQKHPNEIYQVWKGGLASHGGTLGGIIALWLYQRSIVSQFPTFKLLTLFDAILIPTPLACFFIRLGNFFNQEILGTPTMLPWAIIFGDPADGSPSIPRHPVQLYEALCYLGIFLLFISLWYFKRASLRQGFITGTFFFLAFGSRFLLEFLKEPQSMVIDESFLQMGQYLSIPFILFGVGLMTYSRRQRNAFVH